MRNLKAVNTLSLGQAIKRCFYAAMPSAVIAAYCLFLSARLSCCEAGWLLEASIALGSSLLVTIMTLIVSWPIVFFLALPAIFGIRYLDLKNASARALWVFVSGSYGAAISMLLAWLDSGFSTRGDWTLWMIAGIAGGVAFAFTNIIQAKKVN